MTDAFCARILLAGVLVATVVMPLAARGQTPPPPPPPPPITDQTPASVPVPAQTPVPTREAPGAIYKDAMHPLEVVRASLDNWSEAELAALAVGMQKAREACDAAKPDDYQGDDLYDLAHLCAFAQDWSPANDAALKYQESRELPVTR